MIIRWMGHSCFYCQGSGVSLLTDPFNHEVGYRIPDLEVDLVTVSHDHYDHNAVDLLPGQPEVVKGAGLHQVKGLKIKGIPSFHDEVKGAKRGENVIYKWEMDGVRLCHLGDLGHLLEPAAVEQIGQVDILMVPVGGVYTIDAAAACKVVEQLNPRLIIPMHYSTPALSFELGALSDFTKNFARVQKIKVWEGTEENLPVEQEIAVLSYLE
jgi:L-ascorbate metabolism protein UlaG (beta-lactamase superfamily)